MSSSVHIKFKFGKGASRSMMLFLIASIVLACSPVRTGYFNPKSGGSEPAASNERGGNASTVKKPRFQDTTYIYADTASGGQKQDLNSRFAKALKLFDAEKYDAACSQFVQLSGILSEDDSLYYECKFYLAECSLVRKEVQPAKAILEELLVAGTGDLIKQRALVRLGQVFCVLDKKKEAEEYFARLKSDYPGSIYIKLANCQAVGK